MNIRLKKRCDSVDRFEGNLFLDLHQLEIQVYMQYIRKQLLILILENCHYLKKERKSTSIRINLKSDDF